MPTGRLMKKVQRQENWSVSQPPRVGPTTGATTMPRPNKAVAVPRWVGGKLSNRMAWESGCMAPPPKPCKIREITSIGMEVAIPQVSEANVNNAVAGDQKSFTAQKAGEPGTGRQDDRIGHQIARQHPGGLILCGAKISRDIRQRHHNDGSVQNAHERCQHHRQRNQPWIGARAPFRHGRGSGVAHLTLTFGSTDMPGAMSRSSGSGLSKTILTGTRWTTLT